MDDIVCRVINLPSAVNAVTVVDEFGTYNIYVNAKLSFDAQREAFDHERRHIRKNHFYKKEKPIAVCETEAKARKKPRR